MAMEPHTRAHLEALMAAMAGGDRSVVVAFIDAFGDQLAASVRRHLHDLHRSDVARDRDELNGLVTDVALAIADRAGGWAPDGGALPWTWADRAIRGAVVASVGHARVDVEPDQLDGLAVAAGASVSSIGAADFTRLADTDPRVARLREAIAEAASNQRDAEVHVEYQLQKRCGDPSPADTVAALFDLSAANVRQIDCRLRKRLTRLVERDSSFASLAELAWLDGSPPVRSEGPGVEAA